MIKSIKQILQSGAPSVGSWMQLPSANVAEIMGAGGFDWVAVDLEHGPIAARDLPDIFRALELHGTAPFVRVAQCAAKDIRQAADAGARGIIIPMIESREQIEQAVAWALYPPVGTRGVGYSRANLFGQKFSSYFPQINGELTLVAQIESIAAVRNLEAIASVPGVSALMIGPYDLSASMGLTGQFEHSAFKAAIAECEAVGRRCQIALGSHVIQPDPGLLAERIAAGYRFIAYGADGIFLGNGAKNPRNVPL